MLELRSQLGYGRTSGEIAPTPGMIGCRIGDRVGRLCKRTSLDGGAEEEPLEFVKFPFQGDDVEAPVLGAERVLDRLIDLGMGEHTLIGSLGRVVVAGDAAAGAEFLFELHHGLEEVGVEPEASIERMQEPELRWRIVAVVAHGAADDGEVFLFDEAVIVLAIGTASGEGDPLLVTVAGEFVVDELCAVVGVQAQQGERQACPDILEAGEDMDLGLILHGFRLGPGSCIIGEG